MKKVLKYFRPGVTPSVVPVRRASTEMWSTVGSLVTPVLSASFSHACVSCNGERAKHDWKSNKHCTSAGEISIPQRRQRGTLRGPQPGQYAAPSGASKEPCALSSSRGRSGLCSYSGESDRFSFPVCAMQRNDLWKGIELFELQRCNKCKWS